MNAHQPLPRLHGENSCEGALSFAYGVFVLALNGLFLAFLTFPVSAPTSIPSLFSLAGKMSAFEALGALGSLIALALGYLGLMRHDGQRTLAAWGVGLNSAFLAGVLCLGVLALASR